MQKATAETLIPLDSPQALLTGFLSHLLDDHGMVFDRSGDNTHSFAQDGYVVELSVQPSALRIRLEAPDDNAMIFSKEGIVHHVAELDPDAAQQIRWSGAAPRVGEFPKNFRLLTVKRSEILFTGMQRVTLHYPDIDSLQGDGIHLRLIMPLNPARTPVWPVMGENGAPVWPQREDALHARYVTLKNIRSDVQEVDIDIVRHGTGLVSGWAQNTQAGQIVGAMGPTGRVNLPKAQSYFLAADGTGLPAIARFLENLPATACGDVVVALPDGVSPQSYFPETPLNIHTLTPDMFEAEVLDHALRLTRANVTDYGFFAGEFSNAQALRKHFKAGLGLDKTSQLSTAYWRRER